VYVSGEALMHYERALELWDAVATTSGEVAFDRVEVLRSASEAASRVGEGACAVKLDREALARTANGDGVAAALAHERLGRHLLEAGRGEDALPELRRAVELMPHAPTTERTQVLATEAQVLMLCHHFASAEARCEDALALARTLGARDIEANLLNTVAASFTYAGHPERGAEAAMQALAIARELGLVREIGRAYVNGSDALDHAGRVQAAIALAREGVEACGELGVDRFFGDCLRGEIAGRLVRSAQWDAAAELLDELLERTPTGISAGNGYGHRAVLHAVRGDVERMEEAVRRGERHVDRSGGSMWLAPLAEARATSELWEGRPEDAAATIDAFLIAVAGAESIVSTIRIYELGVRAASDLALRAVGEARAAEAARARIERLLDRADGLAALLSGFGADPRARREAGRGGRSGPNRRQRPRRVGSRRGPVGSGRGAVGAVRRRLPGRLCALAPCRGAADRRRRPARRPGERAPGVRDRAGGAGAAAGAGDRGAGSARTA
jgi:tetratricopeptide (TPR) repeat protein